MLLKIESSDGIADVYLASIVDREPITKDVYFHLLKQGENTEGHTVRAGQLPSCTCLGFKYRGKCKHASTLTNLLQEGALA